jgi:hypothetical protein
MKKKKRKCLLFGCDGNLYQRGWGQIGLFTTVRFSYVGASRSQDVSTGIT